jgi:hypothetical protein
MGPMIFAAEVDIPVWLLAVGAGGVAVAAIVAAIVWLATRPRDRNGADE